MHAIVADKREELIDLCRQFDVIKLEVFGSAARGDDFNPASSDVDLIVRFDPASKLRPFRRYMGFREAAMGLFRRKVELMEVEEEGDGLMAMSNRYLRDSINESRETIHEA